MYTLPCVHFYIHINFSKNKLIQNRNILVHRVGFTLFQVFVFVPFLRTNTANFFPFYQLNAFISLILAHYHNAWIHLAILRSWEINLSFRKLEGYRSRQIYSVIVIQSFTLQFALKSACQAFNSCVNETHVCSIKSWISVTHFFATLMNKGQCVCGVMLLSLAGLLTLQANLHTQLYCNRPLNSRTFFSELFLLQIMNMN